MHSGKCVAARETPRIREAARAVNRAPSIERLLAAAEMNAHRLVAVDMETGAVEEREEEVVAGG